MLYSFRQARLESQVDRGSARAPAEALQEVDEEKQPDGRGLPGRQLPLHYQGRDQQVRHAGAGRGEQG